MRYILRRLAMAPIPLLLVALFVFVVLRLSGDPVLIYLGQDATPAQVALMRAQMRLDDPLMIQFGYFLLGMLRGDFGLSLQFGAPALQVVAGRLGGTLELLGLGLLVAVGFGVPAGIAAAARKDRLPDFALTVVAVIAQSMPSFWLGILLIQLFSLELGWLPTSGRSGWTSAVMPALTLGVFLLPNFLLVTRATVLDTLGEMFVTTARARGASSRRALWRHAVPNAMNPVISMLGLQLGRMMGGAVVTEAIFAWPGIGSLMVGAIGQRDVPVVMVGVLLTAVTIVVANLVVDCVQAVLDPRIGQTGV